MSPPLNIMHVMTRIPVGGVENQLLQVLRTYDRTKLNPLVVSLSDKGNIGQEIEAEGIELVCLNKLGHQFRPSMVDDLARIMSERKIHILRTHQYHANFYGRLAARRVNVPCVVASVHNIYTRDRKLHRRLFNRYLARYTDKIVAVSEPVRADILKYDRVAPEKITVITNGVDVTRFADVDGAPVRDELGLPEDAFVVGTVGRLTEQKDQKTLLEAASRLKNIDDVRVIIIGDGPLMEELRSLSVRLGISDRTVFTGMRRDIPALLAAMNVFVLPSLWEGMPNALIEALAAGKPLIATDIPPFRAIIDSTDVAMLFPERDARSLAGAIERLQADPGLCEHLGMAARERAISRHSIQNTVDRYSELFGGILASKGIKSW
jgi:glycosyltransferase involved in cell wall biosynthesis